jgi:predicted DNA-binding ArsR family transcriptional regulator
MTTNEIIDLIDEVGKDFGLFREEKTHLKRFFLMEYCTAWMSVGTIARYTGTKERSMVYRSVKIVQDSPQFRLPAHKINYLIRANILGHRNKF